MGDARIFFFPSGGATTKFAYKLSFSVLSLFELIVKDRRKIVFRYPIFLVLIFPPPSHYFDVGCGLISCDS
jgi:hypothetical protein